MARLEGRSRKRRCRARTGPPFDTAAAPPAQDEVEGSGHIQAQLESEEVGGLMRHPSHPSRRQWRQWSRPIEPWKSTAKRRFWLSSRLS